MFRRLKSRVPERCRWLLAAGFAALIAFEIWRVIAALEWLRPAAARIVGLFEGIAAYPLPVALASFTIAALTFAIPMGVVVWTLRKAHRWLSQNKTAC